MDRGPELRTAAVLAKDLLLATRLEDGARTAGFTVVIVSDPVAIDPDVAVVLVDLDGYDEDSLSVARSAAPRARHIGFLSHTDRVRWQAAEALGFEVFARRTSTDLADVLGYPS